MTATATAPTLSENWSATQPTGEPGRVALLHTRARAVKDTHGVVWIEAKDGAWFRALSRLTASSFIPAWADERAKEEAAAIHAALLPYAAKERRERLTRQARGDYDED